jgi:hypothetical protein
VAIVRHALADLERGWGNRVKAADLYLENLDAYRGLGNPEGIADSLVGLVLCGDADTGPEAAVRALAAAAALRQEAGTAVHGGLRAAHDGLIAWLRAALGEKAFAEAWEEGSKITPEAALGEAIELVSLARFP